MPQRVRWRNWAGNQRADAELLQPASVDEVVEALRTTTASGRRIRPIGSGHSSAAVGRPEDLQMSLDRLTGLRSIGEQGLVTVWAGTTLHRLNAELARRGWALTSSGDIDRQTLAGALATGTHGTGARFGGLATQVRGLEMVTPEGTVLTCSATENADVFAAARVGLGALGVVTAVTVQAERAFALRAEEGPGTLTAALRDFDGLMTSTDHVELYWFPHTDETLVKRSTRVPLADVDPLPRWRAVWDDEVLANAALDGFVAGGRRVPALAPPLARVPARAVAPRTWTDHSHRVFVSRRRMRCLGTEWAVPREAAADVLRGLRRLHQSGDWRSAFPVEVRLAASDDIPLSPAYGRDTAYIAAHVPAGAEPGPWFAAVGKTAAGVGGRPHWGKLHELDADSLRPRYPLFDAFVGMRQRLDPTGVLSNAYLDRVLGPIPTGPAGG